MKYTLRFLLFAVLLQLSTFVSAQYKWENPLNQPFFVIHGQAFQNESKGTYLRLPQRVRENVRQSVWDLSQQTAGLSVVFYSDAPEIRVRYTVKGGYSMPHMPSTGVSGVDMYSIDPNGQSRWCAGKYSFGDTVSFSFPGLTYDMATNKGYEYHLYLPLYNTVTWMSIGIPTDAKLTFIPPSQENPIVIYGTSIAQGACASRPGMAWTNIIERSIQSPVINFGFSGNGLLEPELFNLLSEINAQLYIIDCMPNMTGDRVNLIYNRTLTGVRKLREHNQAPILLVEHSGYTNEFSSQSAKVSYQTANTELRKAYEAMTKEGIKGLHYLSKEEIGLSMDAMVEGVHPSDLGMQQYADSYLRKIGKILHRPTQQITTCIPCKQNRDPYDWNKRHEEVLQLHKERPSEIVLIGNSITHYWGGEPISNTQRGSESWDKLFENKPVSNLGFGWDKIENALWRIYHGELDGFEARTIFVNIGTNNLQSNTDEEMLAGVVQLVEAIRQKQPQAKLYILGIYPRKDMQERVKEYNVKLQQVLKEKTAIYVDLTSCLTHKDGSINLSLFTDGLHPNQEGYNQIAKGLKKYLK